MLHPRRFVGIWLINSVDLKSLFAGFVFWEDARLAFKIRTAGIQMSVIRDFIKVHALIHSLGCELTGDTVVFGHSAWGDAKHASIMSACFSLNAPRLTLWTQSDHRKNPWASRKYSPTVLLVRKMGQSHQKLVILYPPAALSRFWVDDKGMTISRYYHRLDSFSLTRFAHC